MLVKNAKLTKWVDEAMAMCAPSEVVWIDGSEEQLSSLKKQAVETGELIKLNEELLPNSYLHRSAQNDVARVEDRTYICTDKKESAGNTNNWMETGEAYSLLNGICKNSMKGRTMYVIPFVMGPIGSKFARYGVEITDSIYVVINMNIMAQIGDKPMAYMNDGADFVKCLHCKAEVDPEKRYICHFPQDDVIISVNSAYGGNALLGKKCMALRIASAMGKKEGWLAEHMLILGIENPQGEVSYIAAAFPSACGKTNLAMLIPPEAYTKEGYKVWCVGDDIAWIHVGDDGRFWAANPENGFFGVAPGTSNKTNKNALMSTQKETIFTNVVHNLDNNTVWWEGMDKNPPSNALDWKGEKWDGTMGTKGAHPNSRFTSSKRNCPCISSETDNPNGVPLSAIFFGGRRAKLLPLVYEARNFEHGVFMGSAVASETTAAATGAVGVVRRDPMAMIPFCGYNIGDYFEHWLEIGKKATNPPKFFNVNWFRTNDAGEFVWPGFGDNMRVLTWALDRCAGKAEAVETPIGYMPKVEDINPNGLGIGADALKQLLSIDKNEWMSEIANIEEFYTKLETVPERLKNQLGTLKANIERA